MKIPNRFSALYRLAICQGWRVERTSGGHLRWVPPDADKPFVISASSPSDLRAVRNLRQYLRASGLVIA